MPSLEQPCQSHIDALSERFERQDDRFNHLEAKINKFTQEFEKLPVFDRFPKPPKTSPELLMGGSDSHIWVVYKPGWTNEFEKTETEPTTSP